MAIQEIIIGDSDLDSDWLKHIEGGKHKRADLSAHDDAFKKKPKTSVQKSLIDTASALVFRHPGHGSQKVHNPHKGKKGGKKKSDGTVTITLYHGTTAENAKLISEEGWNTGIRIGGIAQGAPPEERALTYLSPGPRTAKWFAEANTRNRNPTVVEVEFTGKILEVPKAKSIYDAARWLDVDILPGTVATYDFNDFHKKLAVAGYQAVSYKDINAGNRPTIAVFDTSSLSQPSSKALATVDKASLTYKSGNHTGAMIAFFIPPGVAHGLALPDGESPEDLHITLAYLGKASDIFDKDILIDTVRNFAQTTRPISGTIQGIGRFTNTGEDDAFYASFDCVEIQEFRAMLVDIVESFGGVDVSRKHGFTPHITLKYLKPDQPVPIDTLQSVDVTFDRISLVLAGDRIDFPLMGELEQKAGARHSKRDRDILQAIHDKAVEFGAVCKAGPYLRKAGARHSAGDNRLIQTVHDNAVALGAVCRAEPYSTKADYTSLFHIIDILKGGPGSGNWGHKGRKGKLGGSAPRGATSGLRGGIRKEGRTPPPPGAFLRPNVRQDKDGDGVTDMARVGVAAHDVPPPPKIGRLPNLTADERKVESDFIKAYEADPDGMASKFRELAIASGDPPTFGTDDAKVLTSKWSDPAMSLEERSVNRAIYNTALHQTANAVTKRAFVQHLDTLQPGDEVLITVGGVGAGKGYALKNVPEALDMKKKSKAVWDSAGDQNATENPWIQAELEKRGLKGNYVYVHADARNQWANPERGVVQRAKNPKDGRMVDARVFADSYAIGAQNHQAFVEKNQNNPNASFVFLDNTGVPKRMNSIPKPALNLDADDLYDFALDVVAKSDAPAHVKRGAVSGERIWGSS